MTLEDGREENGSAFYRHTGGRTERLSEGWSHSGL